MTPHPYKLIAVLSLLFLFSCGKEETITNDDIIKLQVGDTSNIRADNNHILTITALLPANVSDDYKSVTFETTSGTFIDNSQLKLVIPINQDNFATAHLRVGKQIGNCLITATIGSSTKYSASLNLGFGRAYPDSILVETDVAAISLGGNKKVNIVANLFRNKGDVSLGTQVFFEAFQSVNNNIVSVGRFSGIQNSFTNDKGIASIDFYGDTGDILSNNKIMLKIKSQNDFGNPLIKTIYINVNP